MPKFQTLSNKDIRVGAVQCMGQVPKNGSDKIQSAELESYKLRNGEERGIS